MQRRLRKSKEQEMKSRKPRMRKKTRDIISQGRSCFEKTVANASVRLRKLLKRF